jgi:hypothetical protein
MRPSRIFRSPSSTGAGGSLEVLQESRGQYHSGHHRSWIRVRDKLAKAIGKHADAISRSHEVKHTNALEDLAEKIDEALDVRR